MFNLCRKWRAFKKQTLALFFVLKNADAPLKAKFMTLFALAYLFIPLDFVPDFIPLFGLLDDLILVPLALTMAARLTPPSILNQAEIDAAIWWKGFRYKFLIFIGVGFGFFVLLTYLIWIAFHSPL